MVNYNDGVVMMQCGNSCSLAWFKRMAFCRILLYQKFGDVEPMFCMP